MKKIFLAIVLSWLSLASAQELALPASQSFFYEAIDMQRDLSPVKRMNSSKNLLRETFTKRYAPKAIKTDLDIISRMQKYAVNPNMRYQDIGWLFETYVKNKYSDIQYVKSSTAKLNDVTSKINGKFLNGQLKAHKSGNPRTYFKDMQRGYNSLFVVPNDHVKPLKDLIKSKISQRNTLTHLAETSKISSSQKKALSNLKSLNLESKLARVKGGGVTYKGLERILDNGLKSLMKSTFKPATAGVIMSSINASIKGLGYAVGIGVVAYEAYDIYGDYSDYSNNMISQREFTQGVTSKAIGIAGAWIGSKIGAWAGAHVSGFLFGADFGACTFIGGVFGGAVGYFGGNTASNWGFNSYYASFNEESKKEVFNYLMKKYD